MLSSVFHSFSSFHFPIMSISIECKGYLLYHTACCTGCYPVITHLHSLLSITIHPGFHHHPSPLLPAARITGLIASYDTNYMLWQQAGVLSDATAKQMFGQLISAVRYCHSLNIAHRDLKCENVLLDRDLNAKVTVSS